MQNYGKFDRILSLTTYCNNPVYVHVNYLNGKNKRFRYDSANSFFAHRNDDKFDFVVIDDVFVQQSLLSNMDYLMVYCHEE